MTMVLSEDTRHHLRAACKENLLAIRALLDLLIGEVEPAPPRAPAPTEGAATPRAPRRPSTRRSLGSFANDPYLMARSCLPLLALSS